ncbi:MAG: hypothetical protein JKY70_22510 [Mucilaginibacter sp.]|nr:hypothetical protein [Mucilaginibacter sp.]
MAQQKKKSARKPLAGECPDNKFSYSLNAVNATVLSLKVEDWSENSPGASGDFTTCINDASASPKVRVIGLAQVDNPGGHVSLGLKFLSNEVFTTPKEFTLAGDGFLKLDVSAKLP